MIDLLFKPSRNLKLMVALLSTTLDIQAAGQGNELENKRLVLAKNRVTETPSAAKQEQGELLLFQLKSAKVIVVKPGRIVDVGQLDHHIM